MSIAKRATPKSQLYHSPIHDRLDDIDVDPYAPTIVEDLLQGISEWRNVQDIVRLTFKALTEVVKVHGESIRDLERQMATRASKAEVSSGLSLKANTADVSSNFSDLIAALEGKVSIDDCQTFLRDYVLRTDFQYLMSTKANHDDIKAIMDSKLNTHELKAELSSVNDRLDDLYRDVNKKLSNTISQREFQSLMMTVDQKANLNEMNEQLESKANKQTVSNALHKKANRAEIEALLARKAEISDLQRILDAIDSKLDGAALERINQLLESKVDKNELNLVASSLQNKAEKTDFDFLSASLSNVRVDNEHRLLDLEKKIDTFRTDLDSFDEFLNTHLDKKADSKDLDRLTQLLGKKADIDHLGKIRSDLGEDVKYVRDDLHQFKRLMNDELSEKHGKSKGSYEKLSDEVYRLSDQIKLLTQDRKADADDASSLFKTFSNSSKKELQLTVERFSEDLDRIRRDIDDGLAKKLDKKEWTQAKTKLVADIDAKADLKEVQVVIDKCQNEMDLQFKEYKDQFKGLVRDHEDEIYNLLSKKANLSDLNAALVNKADMSIFHSVANQKVDAEDFEALRRKIEKLAHNVENSVPANDFETLMNTYIKNAENLHRDLALKANISDVCTMLDTKSNIDDVNLALMGIHKELDTKANTEELVSHTKEQSLINESLCTENIAARWAWKSGDLKSGSMVPWEIQLSNTLPDNFLWEKDKTNILTVAPGLYEVTFGFFAKKKPSVQLLVNGEPILSAVNTASYVIHHSTTKGKDLNMSKQTPSTMTGLTVVDFLILPARARISIAYSGEFEGEGFLGLRRL